MTIFIQPFAQFLVLRPLPGDKISAKILDHRGREVPKSDYDLTVDGENFTFKFKKPHRSRSGKYTLVFSLDGAETETDINVNFLGKISRLIASALNDYGSFLQMFHPLLAMCQCRRYFQHHVFCHGHLRRMMEDPLSQTTSLR